MAVDVYTRIGEKREEEVEASFSVFCLRFPPDSTLAASRSRLFTNATACLHLPNCTLNFPPSSSSTVASTRTIIAFVLGGCSRMFFLFVNNSGLNWWISNWCLIDVAATFHIAVYCDDKTRYCFICKW